MLIYSAAVTLYLAYLGFAGGFFWRRSVAGGYASRNSLDPSRARLDRRSHPMNGLFDLGQISELKMA
jgi:hypothetical protein